VIRHCSHCEDEVPVEQVQRLETYVVRGRSIDILADVIICKECGESIYDGILDEQNLSNAYSEYRNIERILGPEDIRGLRSRYGLSQRGLATLLGWSPATICRYESGSIPSNAHNEQLKRFYSDISYVSELYNEHKAQLSSLEKTRLKESLKALPSGAQPAARSLLSLLQEYYSVKPQTLYEGNRVFDIDRLVNVTVYFADNCRQLVKSKLLKLLWCSDFLSYKRTGRSLTGVVYCHNDYGPIPFKHNLVLAYLEEVGAIDIRPLEGEGKFEGEYVAANARFDPDLFSVDELSIIRDVFKTFRHDTARSMTNKTHREDAYIKTGDKDLIPYTFAETLRAIT
jgi:putative zinc finger/helix-turn-helix YgiT family protein